MADSHKHNPSLEVSGGARQVRFPCGVKPVKRNP
jgi:hypothetical protein